MIASLLLGRKERREGGREEGRESQKEEGREKARKEGRKGATTRYQHLKGRGKGEHSFQMSHT